MAVGSAVEVEAVGSVVDGVTVGSVELVELDLWIFFGSVAVVVAVGSAVEVTIVTDGAGPGSAGLGMAAALPDMMKEIASISASVAVAAVIGAFLSLRTRLLGCISASMSRLTRAADADQVSATQQDSFPVELGSSVTNRQQVLLIVLVATLESIIILVV